MNATLALLLHPLLGLVLVIVGVLAGDHSLVEVGIGYMAGTGGAAATAAASKSST